MADANDTSTSEGGRLARQALGLLTNVAILTALLVYFGWRRSETQATRLGFDESVLGLSTKDYLLRSVGPVMRLLAVILAIGIVLLRTEPTVHRFLATATGTPRRAAATALRTAWLTLPGVVYLVGFRYRATAFVAFPLAIGLGALLLLYADRSRDRQQTTPSRLWPAAEASFVVGVLAVTTFWAGSNYADVLGRQVASRIASNVVTMTHVRVLSENALAIEGPGVAVKRLSGDRYRYEYTGLRFFEVTERGVFLLPQGWTRDEGTLILIQKNDGVRYDFGGS